MTRNHFRITRAGLLATALVLSVAACGDDDQSSATTESVVEATDPSTTSTATTTPAETVAEATTTTAAPETTVEDSAPETTEAPSTEAPTTVAPATTAAPTTTVAPDALQALPGMAAIVVTVDGADASRPTISWPAPTGAASYQLAVQTADGTPVWGWTGDETAVVFGGAARPANVEGPTLTGPSRVRVYAFDAANLLVAVSAWTPTS